ncbi:MAG TPA: hypothetical protein PLG94_02455 [Smithellaceae bacterium]|nr:hypothetical protein [Smithellaceae bacterium]
MILKRSAVTTIVIYSLLIGCLVAYSDYNYNASSQLFFTVEMQSSQSGDAQVFFDDGDGYNERDSYKQQVHSGSFNKYVFPLTRKSAKSIRFDPINLPAVVQIKRTCIENRKGEVIKKIPIRNIRPIQQIKKTEIHNDVLIIHTIEDAYDPITILESSRVDNLWWEFLINENGWKYLGYVLLSILCLSGLSYFGIFTARRQYFALFIGFLPIVYMFSFYNELHTLPNNDYWHMFSHFFIGDVFTVNMQTLFIRQNEHLCVIPKLIYLINYYVTQGSNKGLFVINFFLVFTQLFIISRVVKNYKIFYQYLAVILTAFLLFSPTAAHNWMLSFSGNNWFLANMFAFSAFYFYCLHKYEKALKTNYYISFILSSVLASLTYSTGVYALVALIIFLAMDMFNNENHFDKKNILNQLSLLLFMIIVTFWYLSYRQTSNYPYLSINMIIILKYSLAYLGGIFSNDINIAILMGGIGIVILLACSVYSFISKNINQAICFGLLVCLYTVISAFTTAMARSAVFGLEQALSSRYASLSQLFWIGLAIIGLFYFQNYKKRITVAFLAIAVVLPGYINGVDTMNLLKDRYSRQSLAVLSIQKGVYDMSLIRSTVTLWPEYLLDNINNYRKLKHVPFHKN